MSNELPLDVAPKGSDLAEFAEEYMPHDDTTVIELVRPPGGVAQCFVVVYLGGKAALINVINARSHLSVDVRGYEGGREGEVQLRGFTQGMGDGSQFVPGRFALGVVMVGHD